MAKDTRELRELTANELNQKLTSLQKELYELRTKARMGSVDKPSHINERRRGIARILTIIREQKDK